MSVTVSTSFNRTSGVGPLHIHCDATGTTSTQTSRPFHECRYIWQVTDAPSGVDLEEKYTNGSTPMPKFKAYGAVAGFLLETPGSYTIKLSVWDGVDYAETTQAITVTDPSTYYSGTNTICFSNTADFTGAPTGATQVTTSSWNTAMGYLAQNKRLLFKRGDTFTSSAVFQTTANGPWTIGAFGTGSKPIINANSGVDYSSGGILTLANFNSVGLGDIRVMDLTFSPALSACTPIWQYGEFDNQTYLRLDGYHTGSLITYIGQGNGHLQRYTGVFECTNQVKTITSLQYFTALKGDYMTIRGNYGDQTGGGTHSLRVFHGYKCHIANNTFIGGDNLRHCIKLHSDTWTAGVPDTKSDSGGYASYNVINFNMAEPTEQCAWPFAFAPQDDFKDERVDENVIESNYVYPYSGMGTQVGIYVAGTNNTIRNNVSDLTNTIGSGKTCVGIYKRGTPMPAPSGNEVFNNTGIYLGTGANYRLVQIGANVSGTIIRNNIGYAPSASAPVIISDSGTGTVTSNNTSNLATNPNLSSATPDDFLDYVLQSGSPYKAAGTSVKVFTDALGNSRNVHSEVNDVGAMNASDKQHRLSYI